MVSAQAVIPAKSLPRSKSSGQALSEVERAEIHLFTMFWIPAPAFAGVKILRRNDNKQRGGHPTGIKPQEKHVNMPKILMNWEHICDIKRIINRQACESSYFLSLSYFALISYPERTCLMQRSFSVWPMVQSRDVVRGQFPPVRQKTDSVGRSETLIIIAVSSY